MKQILNNFKNTKFVVFTTLLFGSAITYRKYHRKIIIRDVTADSDKDFSDINSSKGFQSLPTYTRKQVSSHYSTETGIWVTYKDGVYDVTEFAKVHPGGEAKIMLVAGGALEPFWEMYSFHKKDEIAATIDKYLIGKLAIEDRFKLENLPNYEALKQDKVERSPYLLKHLAFPYCAECPPEHLLKNFYTPNDYFFVRNHNPIPEVATLKSNYKLKIFDKCGVKKKKLSIEELKEKYKPIRVEAIMMCTGNRRKDMGKVKKPRGISWNTGAIGNGIWEGIKVSEVLKDMGYNERNCQGLHLVAEGWDKDFQGVHYDVSIPLETVFSEEAKVILAYKYNDAEIPFEHGYPLRLVVPGHVGVRNVKWLKSIKVSEQEAQGPYQQKDYKIIPQNQDWEKVDLSKIKPVMKLPLNSVIVEPTEGSSYKVGDEITFRGWAMGEAGSKLTKIQISLDKGSSWDPVEKLKFNQDENNKVYGWTLWEHKIKLNSDEGPVEVWVRAEDERGNVQPLTVKETWNERGLMNNSIHKISINLI